MGIFHCTRCTPSGVAGPALATVMNSKQRYQVTLKRALVKVHGPSTGTVKMKLVYTVLLVYSTNSDCTCARATARSGPTRRQACPFTRARGARAGALPSVSYTQRPAGPLAAACARRPPPWRRSSPPSPAVPPPARHWTHLLAGNVRVVARGEVQHAGDVGAQLERAPRRRVHAHAHQVHVAHTYVVAAAALGALAEGARLVGLLPLRLLRSRLSSPVGARGRLQQLLPRGIQLGRVRRLACRRGGGGSAVGGGGDGGGGGGGRGGGRAGGGRVRRGVLAAAAVRRRPGGVEADELGPTQLRLVARRGIAQRGGLGEDAEGEAQSLRLPPVVHGLDHHEVAVPHRRALERRRQRPRQPRRHVIWRQGDAQPVSGKRTGGDILAHALGHAGAVHVVGAVSLAVPVSSAEVLKTRCSPLPSDRPGGRGHGFQGTLYPATFTHEDSSFSTP
eukprot:scaffold1950_cov366-Prasinococcus_capsulatus_cf.AAC.2